MTEQETKDVQSKHNTLRVKLDRLDGADRSLALKDLYATNQMQNVQNSIDAFSKIPELSKLNATYLNTIKQAAGNPEALITGADIVGKEKKAYDSIGSIIGADILARVQPAESSKPWILDIGEHAKPKHIFEAGGNLEPMNKAWLFSSAVPQLKSATDYSLSIKEAKKALSQGIRLNSIDETVKNSASHNMKHEMTAAEIAAKEWEKLASADYLKQFGATDYTANQLQSVQNSINAFKQTAESAGGYDKILELAKNSVAPFSYAEEAIKNLNQHKHIFEAASNLESINKALMSSSAMAQLKSTTDYLSSIKEAEKALSQGVRSDSIAEMVKNSTPQLVGIEENFKPENFDFLQKAHHDTYMPRTFEIPKIPENPIHATNKKLDSLIERTDNQLELQRYHFEEQLKQSDKQHNERLEQQQRQIENGEKDSKNAMKVAIVSIVFSVVFSISSIVASFYIYRIQDESDEKNHKEINQALNKIADSMINSNTQQTKNNDKLIEAITKQKGKNER